MTDSLPKQWFYGYMLYALVAFILAALMNLVGDTNELPDWLYTLLVLSVGFALGKAHGLLSSVINLKTKEARDTLSKPPHNPTHSCYIDSVVVERK